ncbi:MAG: F0F1 ATP synthase subunit B [Terrisporobacter sp.]|uniref:F0F1 ATP synthase subunit B n=1 Tax=Terrisporobacter sp. TaxID=1965305 RepID=UPI002FC9BBB2
MGVKPVVTITYELVIQIINTAVLFWILKRLLFQKVLDIVDAREKGIKEDIATGAQAKDEGLALKEQYEQKLHVVKNEGQEIIKQATLRAEQKSEEIISTAKEEAGSIKDRANKDIAQEKEKVMNELKNDISNIAILAASKVIEKDIDQSKHEEMINKFIEEVGEAK